MLVRSAQPLYFDYAASTPLDPAVAAAMREHLETPGLHANPSSTMHAAGRRAAAVVEKAREDVAAMIEASPSAVVFTSGATEANNLALFGTAQYRKADGRHILAARIEHKAVTAPLERLAADGFDVDWLPIEPDGRVAPASVAAALRPDTILVTLMAVNNETGVIQDVAAVAALCRAHGASFHIDAAQAPGKLPLSVAAIGADSYAFSAHKFYGPKGIGALVCPAEFAPRIEPQIVGGAHERGLRAGTPATHQVAGFGAAAVRCREQLNTDLAHVDTLSAQLSAGLTALPGVAVNAAGAPRVPHIVSVRIADIDADSLMYALDPVAVSAGSACDSMTAEPSAVLRAMGLSASEAERTLRFSLGRFSTAADVDACIAQVASALAHLRAAGAEPGLSA